MREVIAKRLGLRLCRWYRRHARILPWRGEKDPYRIWVSEVMLQQTTVEAVVPYYETWMRRFPDVASLAGASEREVLKTWQGLGYYRRARNLHRSACLVCRDFSGRLPDDPDALGDLPGFGPYTTAAVLSIAFGRALPVIDANVRRVMMRVLGLSGRSGPVQDKQIRPVLDRMMPPRRAGDFNQALMEVGALVCRPTGPRCHSCPLRDACRAAALGRQETIPTPRSRRVETVDAVVAVIVSRGRYFLQRRPREGLLGGLWEFPGGKIEGGESEREALEREVREELGVDLAEAEYAFHVRHAYTRFRVRLSVWFCRLHDRPARNRSRKWLRLRDLDRYPMPAGTARIVERLKRGKASPTRLPKALKTLLPVWGREESPPPGLPPEGGGEVKRFPGGVGGEEDLT